MKQKKKLKTNSQVSNKQAAALRKLINHGVKQYIDDLAKQFYYPVDIKGKVTIPEAGHLKHIVACNRFGVYTVIGADNIHHASNKATKLFGPGWTSVRLETGHITYRLAQEQYQFTPVKEFRELLKSLRY